MNGVASAAKMQKRKVIVIHLLSQDAARETKLVWAFFSFGVVVAVSMDSLMH